MIILISLLTILAHSPKIKIENAWVRPAGKGMNSALYFNIANNNIKPDVLYKVSSPVAELVQMHKTVEINGLAEMKQIKSVTIPANKRIEFKPGSYHVMLIQLKRDLNVGQKIDFIFYFKKAGRIKISAIVKAEQ